MPVSWRGYGRPCGVCCRRLREPVQEASRRVAAQLLMGACGRVAAQLLMGACGRAAAQLGSWAAGQPCVAVWGLGDATGDALAMRGRCAHGLCYAAYAGIIPAYAERVTQAYHTGISHRHITQAYHTGISHRHIMHRGDADLCRAAAHGTALQCSWAIGCVLVG